MRNATKELVTKLGTMADSRLAMMYNVPVYHIRKLRQSHNIEKFRGHRVSYVGSTMPSIKDITPRLGEESDAKLASEFGVSRERIRQIRKELSIPINPFGHLKLSREAGEKIVKDLPNLTNSELTKKHGIPPSTIRSLRIKFDIPQKETQTDVEKQLVLQRLIPELGKASDYVLAEKFKLHHAVVRYNRIIRGIPPHKERWGKKLSKEQERGLRADLKALSTEEASAKYGICKALVYQYRTKFGLPGKKLRKLSKKEHTAFIAALGKDTDSAVAKQFGLSTSYVYASRVRRGIKSIIQK